MATATITHAIARHRRPALLAPARDGSGSARRLIADASAPPGGREADGDVVVASER